MRELVIDITYLCNSSCNYCQWNKSNPIPNRELPLNQLLVSKESLKSLGVFRIVITGGEPLISENLIPVINHYRKLDFPIRIITNGIYLNQAKIKDLLVRNIRDFIISIDSLSPDFYCQSRAISSTNFDKIMRNLEVLLDHKQKQDIFVGINVVLTSSNCNWENINDIIEFALERKINQVKFQPVFDDGFASEKAPHLLLTGNNLENLRYIESKIEKLNFPKDFTNPVGFWTDLIDLYVGKTLDSKMCSVSNNAILLHEGVLKFCFWCKLTNYGMINDTLNKDHIQTIRRKFIGGLSKCEVLPQCFCLQSINHTWKPNGG